MEKTIYLVEDDTDIREMITYVLKKTKRNVVAFPTAQAFKHRMEIGFPNLIILDIMLPDGNGKDICSQLKSNATTNNIPILLMSANVSKESSADDFIGKPFDIDDLLKRVEHLLD